MHILSLTLLWLPELLTGASAETRPFGQNSGFLPLLGGFWGTSGVVAVGNPFTNRSGCFLDAFARSGSAEAMIWLYFRPDSHEIHQWSPDVHCCSNIREMMKISEISEKFDFLAILFSCLQGLYLRSRARNDVSGTFSSGSIEQKSAKASQNVSRSLGVASKITKFGQNPLLTTHHPRW